MTNQNNAAQGQRQGNSLRPHLPRRPHPNPPCGDCLLDVHASPTVFALKNRAARKDRKVERTLKVFALDKEVVPHPTSRLSVEFIAIDTRHKKFYETPQKPIGYRPIVVPSTKYAAPFGPDRLR